LRDFCLTIQKGDRMGIRGPSGSGKSTLFHLLLGLYPPVEGSVVIDGVPLTAGNAAAWQKQVGYVPQEVFILDDTLLVNVTLGTDPAVIDHDKVQKALEWAGMGDYVRLSADGLATRLGDGGNKLSGGERQRIGIARALYQDVSVLLLDEATSAVDNQTELEINESIRRLSSRSDLTLLVIAHRGTALDFCDRIIDLGEELQEGPHELNHNL
ncbi:MAG: ABC transporter ATP-binding protein, partial [Marinilabiliales bacterium]|nr:ABC transporter ATP-binding protein [Marinilabiliales bacterium]